MQRTPTLPDLSEIPSRYHGFFVSGPVYDSSCSPEARVWYLERPDLFLKKAPIGTLRTEAEMNLFFYRKGFGPEVLDYFCDDSDWLLTRRIPGEDCTHSIYLSDPQRLCETTASLLRNLHEVPFEGCPIENKTESYFSRAKAGFGRGYWEPDLFAKQWHFPNIEAAWETVEKNIQYMKNDTLLHGDYCLPNIMLDRWHFTGFLDLGNGGIGDRHMDILWGIWTLEFNLHTNRYSDYFMDVYGRDRIEPELLRTAAALEIFT